MVSTPWGSWLGFGGRREKAAPAAEGAGAWANHTIGGLGLTLSPVASSALGVLGCHLHLGLEGDTWQERPGDPSGAESPGVPGQPRAWLAAWWGRASLRLLPAPVSLAVGLGLGQGVPFFSQGLTSPSLPLSSL